MLSRAQFLLVGTKTSISSFCFSLSHTHFARTVKLCKPVGWLPSAPLVKLNKHNGTKKEKQHVCRQSGSLAFHLHFSSSLSRQTAWESTVSPSPSVTVLTPKPPPAWKAEPYSPSVDTCHKSTETSHKYQSINNKKNKGTRISFPIKAFRSTECKFWAHLRQVPDNGGCSQPGLLVGASAAVGTSVLTVLFKTVPPSHLHT